MTIVPDASVVVAALVDIGPEGAWAAEMLTEGPLAAPHHLPVEVASILRRASLRGDISSDTASLAHADLLDVRVELFPYEALSGRAWSLRENVTAYDAWYVALAESLDVPLVTLDGRLTRAPGPQCRFINPT